MIGGEKPKFVGELVVRGTSSKEIASVVADYLDFPEGSVLAKAIDIDRNSPFVGPDNVSADYYSIVLSFR